MKISSIKNLDQQSLFDRDEFMSTIDAEGRLNHGRIRTAIGDYFEKRTAQHVSGSIHKTDCRCDYCPDVSADGIYYEVKAAGNSRQTFIYEGRLERDFEFAKRNELFYFVWSHRVDTSTVSTIAELKERLGQQTKGFAIVPFEFIYKLCKMKPAEKLNSNYGNSILNPTYGAGYRISLSSLKDYWISL